jgi:hypothetical protein
MLEVALTGQVNVKRGLLCLLYPRTSRDNEKSWEAHHAPDNGIHWLGGALGVQAGVVFAHDVRQNLEIYRWNRPLL